MIVLMLLPLGLAALGLVAGAAALVSRVKERRRLAPACPDDIRAEDFRVQSEDEFRASLAKLALEVQRARMDPVLIMQARRRVNSRHHEPPARA
ncbi:MAG: hypothetical protein ACXVQX_01355 [Actinomycetota bacterium]